MLAVLTCGTWVRADQVAAVYREEGTSRRVVVTLGGQRFGLIFDDLEAADSDVVACGKLVHRALTWRKPPGIDS